MSDILAQIDRATLADVAGHVPAKKAARQAIILSEAAACLPDMMRDAEITTELRIEHFLSQLGHESDSFCTTEEYASGAAYEGRKDLGNVHRGDGVRYKGRGLIQLTGRANYRAFTGWMRSFMPDAPDFEAQPDLVEDFPWAGWSAIWFWTVKKLNVVADRDDLVRITKLINGGRNGLDDRERRLAIARRKIVVKTALLPIVAGEIATAQNGFQVLYRGVDDDARVDEVQQALKQLGFYHLAIDGDFGAGTEQAVRGYQNARGLKVDGIVGEKTWLQLFGELSRR